MLVLGPWFGKYGVQKTFWFSFEDVTDVEAPFTGVAPLVADIWVSKDGGAPANATNGMTAVGNGIYSWVATATEMQCAELEISVYDATAGAIFLPARAKVYTRLYLGSLEVDPAQIGGNVDGVKASGVGTGSGILGVGGGSGGHGVAGTAGAGGGLITNFINTLLGAELAAVPTSSTWTLGTALKMLFQRFMFASLQTNSLSTLRNEADAADFATRAVSDNGTTRTNGKFA